MNRYSDITGRGLYRSRKGILFGVCRGLANYFDISVFWTRAIVVIFFIFTGFWPLIGLYILAILLMKPDPSTVTAGRGQKTDRGRCASAGYEAADRLRRKWHHLEKRIRRMEDKVTSREYDWNKRFYG